jgi:F-type H+-transporting ATPase subunit c
MKLLNVCFLAMAFLVCSADNAFGQTTGGGMPRALGAGLGCGLTILGLGIGLGRVGGSALESMARQPEVTDRVQQNMLLIAALVEGAAVISLVFCFLTLLIGN